jgi:hypothetical protein
MPRLINHAYVIRWLMPMPLASPLSAIIERSDVHAISSRMPPYAAIAAFSPLISLSC